LELILERGLIALFYRGILGESEVHNLVAIISRACSPARNICMVFSLQHPLSTAFSLTPAGDSGQHSDRARCNFRGILHTAEPA
jgi:hypothetical protein